MQQSLSHTEENYLKSIYHLNEEEGSEVSTNAIAYDLDTRAASVSDMLKKLSKKGVISYQKYKGVQITDTGKKLALRIIRKHRLWEVFLVEKLGFNWDEVHEIAEQLEHIQSPILTAKLDEFLGFPRMDPHGDPIPDEFGQIKENPQCALSEITPGTTGIIVKVPDNNPSLLQHLDKIGMKLKSKIHIKEKVEFDNSVLVSIDGKPDMYLSGEIAKNIMIALK